MMIYILSDFIKGMIMHTRSYPPVKDEEVDAINEKPFPANIRDVQLDSMEFPTGAPMVY
jgi:hypothetical protein